MLKDLSSNRSFFTGVLIMFVVFIVGCSQTVLKQTELPQQSVVEKHFAGCDVCQQYYKKNGRITYNYEVMTRAHNEELYYFKQETQPAEKYRRGQPKYRSSTSSTRDHAAEQYRRGQPKQPAVQYRTEQPKAEGVIFDAKLRHELEGFIKRVEAKIASGRYDTLEINQIIQRELAAVEKRLGLSPGELKVRVSHQPAEAQSGKGQSAQSISEYGKGKTRKTDTTPEIDNRLYPRTIDSRFYPETEGYVIVPGSTLWIGEDGIITETPPPGAAEAGHWINGRYYPRSVEAMDTEDPQIVYYNGVQGTLYRQTFVPWDTYRASGISEEQLKILELSIRQQREDPNAAIAAGFNVIWRVGKTYGRTIWRGGKKYATKGLRYVSETIDRSGKWLGKAVDLLQRIPDAYTDTVERNKEKWKKERREQNRRHYNEIVDNLNKKRRKVGNKPLDKVDGDGCPVSGRRTGHQCH